MSPFTSLLLVALGGACGSMARYGLSGIVQGNRGGFPWGTLVVNLCGCLVIGILMGWSELGLLRTEWRFTLVVGFLGGFTTFSAFSYEAIRLFLDGSIMSGLGYVVASLIGCLLMTTGGYLTVHMLWR